MTVSTTDSVIEYEGNGVTTAFPVPFKFPANGDLVVTQVYSDVSTTLVLGTDYSVVGAGAQAGGAVIVTSAPPIGATLSISRALDAVQETDLRNQGRYFAETHESVFDYLTMLIQQGFSGLSRALRRPIGKDYFDAESRRISNVSDPVLAQDAATRKWSQEYFSDLISDIQGPVNNAQNVLYVDGDGISTTVQKGIIKQFTSISDVRGKPGDKDGEQSVLLGYYQDAPGVGGGNLYWDSLSVEPDNGGSIIQVTGITTGRWKRDITHGVWAEWFGARNDGTDAAGTTAAVWAAIIALRHDQETIVQYIGGPTVTAYASGRLNFGNGIFALQPDSFDITQDLGLTIVGQGFRGKNQAMKAATTLVVRGTSSGFFFRHYGNGGRNLTFNNIDVVYDDSQFTGDIIETTSSPGLTLHRVRVGCYGGFSASRLTTARSCIRATFDEFIRCEDVVLDGAQYGFYSDGTITIPGLSFGGWGTTLLNCTFYDFVKSLVLHAGNRTRHSLSIISSYFNPINTSPERCHDIDNIEGLIIDGCQHTPSTGSQPSQEWFRVVGSTGRISCNTFAGLSSKLGTIGGTNPSAIEWSNNRVACQGGLTITGGVVRGGGNEYSNADHSVDIAPVAIISLDIGPDIHKAGVTGYSYRISSDSSMLSGRVNYSFEQDNSNSKYYSTSTRVGMSNCDSRFITLAVAGTTLSPYNAGRTYNVTVAGTQTLPAPIPGAAPMRILKSGANALTITTTSGTNFLIGASGSRTSAVATSADVGALIEFEPLTSTAWVGRVLSGTWSFT